MNKHKISTTKISAADKRIKALESTHAYAEYKIRHTGDLDSDLGNWLNNIMLSIEIVKHTK